MTTFRRLAIASTLATFGLVTLGGLVRATKSGLGCGTDWPHCSGELLPALQTRALVIEFSHRAAASLVVVLLGALALSAWRHQRARPRLKWLSLAAFGLVLFQALLGAVVVKLELEAVSVVLHLATAMALLGLLVYVTLVALHAEGRLQTRPDVPAARRAWLAASSVLALLLLGSYVGGRRGAGLAFGDWPLMAGRVIPELSSEPAALHFAHRVLALGVGIVVAAVALEVIRSRAARPLQARFAHVALGSYAVEVAIGAANVWTGLNPLVVTAHLLVGAVIWASLVALAVSSHAVPERVPAGRTRGREPALDVSG